MKHLSFIGMMGSGKTTIATAVASSSGMPFIDLDQKIEEKAKMTIPDIFLEYGEEHFRELEKQALKEAVTELEPSVLATGGGVVLSEGNRKLLKKHSIVVWLSVSPQELAMRIDNAEIHEKEDLNKEDLNSAGEKQNERENKGTRPLLMGAENTLEALTRLYKRRVKLYKKTAHLALSGEMMGVAKLAEKSLEHYKVETSK